MSSALAFGIVKYLGAAYLVYRGVQKIRRDDGIELSDGAPRVRLSRIFAQGIVVNVLNPKAALFSFAFLPPFVDPTRGNVAAQILFLGFFLPRSASQAIACGRSPPEASLTGYKATPAACAPSATSSTECSSR